MHVLCLSTSLVPTLGKGEKVNDIARGERPEQDGKVQCVFSPPPQCSCSCNLACFQLTKRSEGIQKWQVGISCPVHCFPSWQRPIVAGSGQTGPGEAEASLPRVHRPEPGGAWAEGSRNSCGGGSRPAGGCRQNLSL